MKYGKCSKQYGTHLIAFLGGIPNMSEWQRYMWNMFSDTFLCTPKLIPKNSKNLDDCFLIRMTMPNTVKYRINAKSFFRHFSLHQNKFQKFLKIWMIPPS